MEALEEISRSDPHNAQYRRTLGTAHGSVGDALFNHLLDRDGALAAYRRALAIREELAAADPANRGAQQDVAFVHDVIGNTLAAGRDDRGALESHRKAASIFEAMLAVDPAQATARRRLAGTLESLASVAARSGRSADARAASRRSLALRREQAVRPEASAEDLNAFAWQLLTAEPPDLRDPEAAVAPARRAVELTKGQDANVLDTLALAYFLTGDPAGAVETEERALALLGDKAPQRREIEANLARYRAAVSKRAH